MNNQSQQTFKAPLQSHTAKHVSKRGLLEKVNIAYRNRVETQIKAAYPDIDMSQVEITNESVLALIEVLEREL